SVTVPAGSISATLALHTAGNRTITATYSGDANFLTSTKTATKAVAKASTTIAITNVSKDPTVTGEIVTVDFSLTITSPGDGTPTGNVTIADNGNAKAVVPVSAGSASFAFPLSA